MVARTWPQFLLLVVWDVVTMPGFVVIVGLAFWAAHLVEAWTAFRTHRRLEQIARAVPRRPDYPPVDSHVAHLGGPDA